MEKEKYFQLGIIKKEHGLNGRMLLLLDDAIDTLDGIEMLFIQINNVLGLPYIFRGALEVCARAINEPKKYFFW